MDTALNPETGDLDFVNGDSYMVENEDATMQDLRRRIKLFLAEWFLDEREGVPYFDDIFIKNPNMNVVAAQLKKVIIETTNINEIERFFLDLDIEARHLTLDFKGRGSNDEVIEFIEEIEV